MQYTVVEFQDGNYDVVPIKWLLDDYKKTYCPTFSKKEKITRAVNRINDPDSAWKIIPVQHVHGFYETVLAARQKLVRMDKDLETSDPNGKRRRKTTKYFQSPKKSKSTKRVAVQNSPEPSSSESSPQSVPNSAPKFSGTPDSSVKSTPVSRRSKDGSPRRSNSTSLVAPRRNLNFGCTPTTTREINFKHRQLELSGSEQKFRESVISSLAYLRMRMDQLHENQSQIQERLNNSVLRNQPKFTINLPVKSSEELSQLESQIANDPDAYSEIANRLDWIGEKNLRDCVFKTMQKIISNGVAAGLNRSGHNGKQGFKAFELCTIVSNCVHGFFGKKEGNISGIENAIKDWLKAAPGRVASSKKLPVVS